MYQWQVTYKGTKGRWARGTYQTLRYVLRTMDKGETVKARRV